MAKEINKTHREPLFHVLRRPSISFGKALFIRIAAILIAFVVCALISGVLVNNATPVSFFESVFKGSFGTTRKIWKLFKDISVLLCISLAITPAFRMKFWNIGAEGQVLVGALACAACMYYLNGKALDPVIIICMFAASVLAGMVWAGIPALFKAQWNTNETLFTLMMNYVAIQLVSYFYNLWKGSASSLGQINKIGHEGWFPAIMGQRTFINVIIVLVLTVVMYFYLSKTKQGYEISVVGESQNTARYAGINVKAVLIRTMAISGLVCGVCGCMTVAGESQTISTEITSGYGFTAIIVAWLSKFNTFYMAGVSLFIAALERGTALIANRYSTFSTSACDVVVGIMLFCIIGCEFFINYRVMFRGKETVK